MFQKMFLLAVLKKAKFAAIFKLKPNKNEII